MSSTDIEWAFYLGSSVLLSIVLIFILSLVVSQRKIITVQKEKYETVKKSEEKYRLLADNSTELIATYNKQGQPVYISPSCNEITGYKEEQMLKMSVFDLIKTDHKEEFIFRFNSVFIENKVSALSYMIKKKDGTYTWFETNFNKIPNAVSLNDLVLCTSRDITERKQAEKEIFIREHEKKKLQELNELKSEFVSSVSHELKTPISSIRMFTETILSNDVKPSETTEFIKIIDGESMRLTRLITNLLDLNNIEAGIKNYDFKPVKMDLIVQEIIELMDYEFRKDKFEITADLDHTLPAISADEDAVKEAIINIISNAMKYSGKSKNIVIELKQDKDYIALGVTDNGIGIPEQDRKQLFEKFYRGYIGTKSNKSGAGIGLFLVKNIMDAHYGKIEVVSKIGKGSTFLLKFKKSL